MPIHEDRRSWRDEPVTLGQWWKVFIPTVLAVGMIAAGWAGLLAMLLYLLLLAGLGAGIMLLGPRYIKSREPR